ncbi:MULTISPECIES: PilZ domain-containing protein [Paenibacillus]|uniref:PilZ domain-containing protein n=1 Tax=Paenibacillus TaxID=44249 RepID=UPI0022B91AA6|nr:PilZ domain-containing protein [Paenibacillus caseinilyticus]MCZ8520956.1 PilZ domain-containing protein [Paenibacillus caseinilyticus]
MSQENRMYQRSTTALDLSLSIHSIQNRETKTRRTFIELKDISLTGLSFKCSLNFPSHGDFVLKFENALFGEMYGSIVWKENLDGAYLYGVQFLSVSNALTSFLVHDHPGRDAIHGMPAAVITKPWSARY